jgi:hypothetical protein
LDARKKLPGDEILLIVNMPFMMEAVPVIPTKVTEDPAINPGGVTLKDKVIKG